MSQLLILAMQRAEEGRFSYEGQCVQSEFFARKRKVLSVLPHVGVCLFMMSKLGFRRTLPVLFTVVHVALLVYGAHRQTGAVRVRQEVHHLAAYQEGVGPAWTPEPRPLTPAQKIALLLNLPSLVLAVPVATTLFRGTDSGLLYAALPFVPIIWYGIGRWIDSMLGYVRRRWRLPRSLSGFLAILSMGWFALSVCAWGWRPVGMRAGSSGCWQN